MKLALWIVFAVLALCWTGMAVFSTELVAWLLNTVSLDAGGAAQAGAEAAAPAWLALWMDPAMLQILQQLWTDGLRWLAAVLPSGSGLSAWITAAVWVVWGLGSVFLVALFAFLHWLLTKVGAGPRPVHA